MAKQNENNYVIEDFRGGISSERKRGPRGSFKYGENLDIHSEDNVLKCQQALKKDTGTVVTDLVTAMFRGTDGKIYAFGDTGKIYIKSSGTWALFHTDPDGKITGALEYEVEVLGVWTKYIYWATKTKLKRLVLGGAVGAIEDVGTFERGVEPHTMRIAEGLLIVCDGNTLALVDLAGLYNEAGLFIPPGETSKSLLDLDNNVVIGTEDPLLQGNMYIWALLWAEEESWDTKRESQAGSTNAMAFLENGVMLQNGSEGIFRFWNISTSVPLKQLPDTTSAYPGGVIRYDGLIHIGMSGTNSGVYSIGRVDNNDPLAFNLEYKVTGTIGALARDTDNLYVAWKNGAEYGISTIDTANKANGIYEGLEFDGKSPNIEKNWNTIKIITRVLPAGCTVAVKYKTNRYTDWRATNRSDGLTTMVAGESVGIFNLEGKGEVYQIRIELTSSVNNTPEILSINTYFSPNSEY